MMLNKKDGIVSQTKTSLQEVFTCGLCLHHKQTPHLAHDKVCEKMGVRDFAIAPNCYTPDYTQVIENTDEFTSLINFFSSRSASQKKILMGMLRQQPTRAKKLKMGIPIFLKISNREYISNYVAGFVVGYTSGGNLVVAGSPEEQTRGRVFFAYLKSDSSYLTQPEWSAKHAELLAKGAIQDPKEAGMKSRLKAAEPDYEIPTIDNAPKDAKAEVKRNLRTTEIDQILTY